MLRWTPTSWSPLPRWPDRFSCDLSVRCASPPSRIGGQLAARAFARPYRGVAARLRGVGAHRRGRARQGPAIYLHEYTAAGLTVRGLVGALDITREAHRAEDRAVLPHEGIHPAQADELAQRMAEMGMNPAPILLVHHGSPRSVTC